LLDKTKTEECRENQQGQDSGSFHCHSPFACLGKAAHKGRFDKDRRRKITLSALRKAALLTSRDSQTVRFAFAENAVTLSARSPEAGEAKVDLPVEWPFDAFEIGFNPQYLIDALRVMDGPIFRLELGEPTTPGLVREGEGFLYVVMPISLT